MINALHKAQREKNLKENADHFNTLDKGCFRDQVGGLKFPRLKILPASRKKTEGKALLLTQNIETPTDKPCLLRRGQISPQCSAKSESESSCVLGIFIIFSYLSILNALS